MELEPVLTPEEYGRMQAELLRLLSRQIERYTMGDSSSVPVELAQELLSAVCYVLGISPERPNGRWKELAQGDLDGEYQEGLFRIEQKKALGKHLWQTVFDHLPPVESISLLRTLKSIDSFWKRYDSRFFAHQTPWDMEYPLAVSLPDTLQGIDVINQYLTNLWQENRFLAEYAPDHILPVLARSCPDFADLPVNLFESVAANALALAVLEKPDCPLGLEARELEALYDLFQHMSRAAIQHCLERGADRLWERHPTWAPQVHAYLSRYCEQLAPRIDLLRDRSGLGGIFTVTETHF